MPKGRTSKFFFILDSNNLIIPLLLFLKILSFVPAFFSVQFLYADLLQNRFK